jgi:hypothetical protein
MNGSEWYIYSKQDPDHLGISPFVEYADGTKKELVIDNNKVLLYGLDPDFIPSYPGLTVKLLIKYYLNAKEQSPISINDGKHRYMYTEKLLRVIKDESDGQVFKILIFPVWDSSTLSYKLKHILYSIVKNEVIDVTDLVIVENDSFDGRKYYTQQKIVVRLDVKSVYGGIMPITYRQNMFMTLKPTGELEQFILKDSADSIHAYGVDSPEARRPFIEYDSTIQKYFIPTSLFGNKSAFLEAFYTFINPPYDIRTDIEPITPTHFTIRALDNLTTLIAVPIDINQYNQAFNCVRPGSSNQLVGSTVLVEFLYYSNNTYKILYGSPVKVRNAETQYQG